MRLKGDSSVSQCAVKSRLLLILFFASTSISYSQILLNNFGYTQVIKTYSGYNNFTFIDFNEDVIKDLFLFGNQGKSFVIHQGLEDSTFSGPTKKFFFYPIDDFKWLTKSERGDDYYIFVSRNRRLVGLVSFTKSYSLQLLNTIKFNSYPSSITISDFNKDGINEALIYGNNFYGVKLITNDAYLLNSQPVIDEDVFTNVEILNFNQDDLDDILALDAMNNKLTFFENTDGTEFLVNRGIQFNEPVNSFQIYNFNQDNFFDLKL